MLGPTSLATSASISATASASASRLSLSVIDVSFGIDGSAAHSVWAPRWPPSGAGGRPLNELDRSTMLSSSNGAIASNRRSIAPQSASSNAFCRQLSTRQSLKGGGVFFMSFQNASLRLSCTFSINAATSGSLAESSLATSGFSSSSAAGMSETMTAGTTQDLWVGGSESRS
jgi:hypothetical protein